MTKIFIVKHISFVHGSDCSCDITSNFGAFSTEEKAKDFIQKKCEPFINHWGDKCFTFKESEFEIEEFKIDEPEE